MDKVIWSVEITLRKAEEIKRLLVSQGRKTTIHRRTVSVENLNINVFVIVTDSLIDEN